MSALLALILRLMDDILRHRLRLLLHSCLELNLPKSAIFYADKIYALSKDPESCYLLAKVIKH